MLPEVGQKRVLRYCRPAPEHTIHYDGHAFVPVVSEFVPIEIAEVHFAPQFSPKAFVVVDTDRRSWIFALPCNLPERA